MIDQSLAWNIWIVYIDKVLLLLIWERVFRTVLNVLSASHKSPVRQRGWGRFSISINNRKPRLWKDLSQGSLPFSLAIESGRVMDERIYVHGL